MSAEVAFAKSFLTSLDSRPIKLSADHVEDPRNFPSRPPYILPRMPRPMSQPAAPAPAPGHERSISLALKSLRNPPLDIALPAQPLTTSVLDVKAAVAAQTGIAPDKIKILHAKRPLQDSKVLKDLLPAGDATPPATLELAVMVIGGAAAVPAPAAAAATGTGEGLATGEELETDAFWGDLNGFMAQRLKSHARAEELSNLFRASWQASRAS
ncbi:hypothetical protein ESCO_005423 [Escovopsis weberi]|uniref:Ubiquitin-like domain-containing protein n=1 Tax=Escovopsis weberi TaxID=150374 RepID=A0A0M9VV20_ESCWE|nr:hypothetical protein ESCO_005423 [Escovopsis weberi]